LYRAVDLGGGGTFDIVYTGLGALNWVPDVPRWARVMADLAAPGGMLYVAEFHPFQNILGDEDLTVTYPYFHDEPMTYDDGEGTYADLGARTVPNDTVEGTHRVREGISAAL